MSLLSSFRALSRIVLRHAPHTGAVKPPARQLAVTPARLDLGEFFDHEKHRGENRVRVGRSWRKDELRLKSNTDLHKLWYVLLKERNMLLTMEQAYKDAYVAFPNPERLDKVEEGMENLEEVVRERNRAYHLLEAGVTGERDRYYKRSAIGHVIAYKPKERLQPRPNVNTSSMKTNFGPRVTDFLARYREKLSRRDYHVELVQMREAARIIRRFPNVNPEALQDQFPLVNLKKLYKWKRIRGENDAKHDA